MNNSNMTIEEQREERESRYKKKQQKEKARIAEWNRVHPQWSSFTRNRKRNMRKRLRNRV